MNRLVERNAPAIFQLARHVHAANYRPLPLFDGAAEIVVTGRR
jgi:hypothetical protein